MQSSSPAPALPDEIKMIYEIITVDEDWCDENWNVSHLDDKSFIESPPLENESNYTQIKDNIRILPSSSKKRQTNPELWEGNVRKRLRESGQAYVSIKKKEFPARSVKPGCNDCFLK